jgi:hypothetical protein
MDLFLNSEEGNSLGPGPEDRHYLGFVRTLDFEVCIGLKPSEIYPGYKRSRSTFPTSLRSFTSTPEAGRSDRVGRVYLITEKLDGQSFFFHLNQLSFYTLSDRDKTTLSFAPLASVLLQILSSLWYASYLCEFTHYDLHTGNIVSSIRMEKY